MIRGEDDVAPYPGLAADRYMVSRMSRRSVRALTFGRATLGVLAEVADPAVPTVPTVFERGDIAVRPFPLPTLAGVLGGALGP